MRKETNLQECWLKIDELLREYNCRIDYDEKLDSVLLIDDDTNGFEHL